MAETAKEKNPEDLVARAFSKNKYLQALAALLPDPIILQDVPHEYAANDPVSGRKVVGVLPDDLKLIHVALHQLAEKHNAIANLPEAQLDILTRGRLKELEKERAALLDSYNKLRAFFWISVRAECGVPHPQNIGVCADWQIVETVTPPVIGSAFERFFMPPFGFGEE